MSCNPILFTWSWQDNGLFASIQVNFLVKITHAQKDTVKLVLIPKNYKFKIRFLYIFKSKHNYSLVIYLYWTEYLPYLMIWYGNEDTADP